MDKIIIVSGPVIVEDKKVLLDKHGEDNFWKFCGGRVQENESLIEATIRRAKEELGIDVKITNEEPFLMHTTKETADGIKDVVLVHFLAERTGEITPASEVKESEWLNVEDLPKEIAPNVIPALAHFSFL